MLSKLMRQWSGIKNMYAIKDRHDIKGRERAIRAREKIALIYAFIAWNAFGIAFYMVLKKKMPTDSEGRRISLGNLTGAPGNLHIYQVEGFNLKKEFNMKNEVEEPEYMRLSSRG